MSSNVYVLCYLATARVLEKYFPTTAFSNFFSSTELTKILLTGFFIQEGKHKRCD